MKLKYSLTTLFVVTFIVAVVVRMWILEPGVILKRKCKHGTVLIVDELGFVEVSRALTCEIRDADGTVLVSEIFYWLSLNKSTGSMGFQILEIEEGDMVGIVTTDIWDSERERVLFAYRFSTDRAYSEDDIPAQVVDSVLSHEELLPIDTYPHDDF